MGFFMAVNALNPKSRRPVSRLDAPGIADLPLPHERDESTDAAPADSEVPLDPVIEQAKRDIDAGLVDTDMRATPGLNARLRRKLVPGPGGKPPALKG